MLGHILIAWKMYLKKKTNKQAINHQNNDTSKEKSSNILTAIFGLSIWHHLPGGKCTLALHYCYLMNTGGLSAALSHSVDKQRSSLRPPPVHTQALRIPERLTELFADFFALKNTQITLNISMHILIC